MYEIIPGVLLTNLISVYLYMYIRYMNPFGTDVRTSGLGFFTAYISLVLATLVSNVGPYGGYYILQELRKRKVKLQFRIPG